MPRDDITQDQQRLRELFSKHRDPVKALEEYSAEGSRLTLADVEAVLPRIDWGGLFPLPAFVGEFIQSYFKHMEVNSILDPHVSFGEVLLQVIQATQPQRKLALFSSRDSESIFRSLEQPNEIEIRCGNSLSMLAQLDEHFDAVVSRLPLTGRSEAWNIESEVELLDTREALILAAASTKLKSNGVGFFFIASSSLMRRHQKSARSNLEKLGLYLDALLYLPPGTLHPFSGIGSYLAVIKRMKPAQLFIGELAQDHYRQQQLLRNLLKRKPARVAQLGALVNAEEFSSFEEHLAAEELNRFVKNAGLKSVAIQDVVQEINRPKRNSTSSQSMFPDRPNTVYLPTVGNSSAATSVEGATVKPYNLLQLVIDPAVVDANFLVRFLSTPVGLQLRTMMSSKGLIRHITKTSLEQATFYLPDRDTQTAILDMDTRITNTVSQLNRMQRDLWLHAEKVSEINREFCALVNEDEDAFKRWIDTLPSPVATILWSYHGEGSVKEKTEILFHFFEAYSILSVTLLLSGFVNDAELYEQAVKPLLNDTDVSYEEWIKRASFGNWNFFGARLSKQLQRLLDDPDRRDQVLRAFGSPDSRFMDMLTDKSILATLDDAANQRNLWRGHGPLISEWQAKPILVSLENLLAKLRESVTDQFANVTFVQAGAATHREGLFSYTVCALQGARLPFQQVRLETLEPMDDDKLYVVHDEKRRPIALLPFIQLGPGPEHLQSTFYFYSRLGDGGKARYIAYQYAREPEIHYDPKTVRKVFTLFSD